MRYHAAIIARSAAMSAMKCATFMRDGGDFVVKSVREAMRFDCGVSWESSTSRALSGLIRMASA